MSKKQPVTVTYESTDDTAKRVSRSKSYIRRLVLEGRIEGAIRIGTSSNSPWGIPNTWQAPTVPRGNPNFKKQSKSKLARKRKAKGATQDEG